MTNEQATVQALSTKLRARYLEVSGDIDLDLVQKAFEKTIESLKVEQVQPTLAKQSQNVEHKREPISNEITTTAIRKALNSIYNILAEVIMNPEFDPDRFISCLVYWPEMQALAKSYGKRLFYTAPKKGGK